MAANFFATKTFIKQHGVIVTLRSRLVGSYNDATGVVSTTYSDYSTYGFSNSIIPSNLNTDSVINNKRTVILSDLQVNKSALPLPKVNDQVIISGVTLDVVQVNAIKSGNTVAYYSLMVDG